MCGYVTLCGHPQPLRSDTIDLETDTSLQVDISDALSEQEKVKFTVHTKVGVEGGRGTLMWVWKEGGGGTKVGVEGGGGAH